MQTLGTTRVRVNHLRQQEQILAYLKQKKLASVEEITTYMGFSASHIGQHLNKMLSRLEVVRHQRGKLGLWQAEDGAEVHDPSHIKEEEFNMWVELGIETESKGNILKTADEAQTLLRSLVGPERWMDLGDVELEAFWVALDKHNDEHHHRPTIGWSNNSMGHHRKPTEVVLAPVTPETKPEPEQAIAVVVEEEKEVVTEVVDEVVDEDARPITWSDMKQLLEVSTENEKLLRSVGTTHNGAQSDWATAPGRSRTRAGRP